MKSHNVIDLRCRRQTVTSFIVNEKVKRAPSTLEEALKLATADVVIHEDEEWERTSRILLPMAWAVSA